MKDVQVGRRRLFNSGLTERPFEAPHDVVRRHLAMQAQDFGPAKWSIGQRSRGLVDADVEKAFNDGSFIRTHVLRPTWHFVARDDARWLMSLSGPRVQKQVASRHRELGLDARTLSRCEAVIAKAVDGNRHLTRKELGRVLQGKRIDIEGQRLPHILSHCELEMVICSGKLDGKQQTYASFDERVGTRSRKLDRPEAVIELVKRYLTGHGPSTVADLKWWSGLTGGDINQALDALGDSVASLTIGELTLWAMDDHPDPVPPRRGADLLQTYDEVVVGYSASRFFGDPRADQARAAWRDRSVPGATVLVNGAVAGHWKRSARGKKLDVAFVTYETPKPATERALEKAAADLGGFLGLEPAVSSERMRR